MLDVVAMTPVLHVSQRFPASRLCAAPVLPISRHPVIDSRVLVFDLGQDPERLLKYSADEIADRLYTPAVDLPEGEERIGLKEIHLNRCPALTAWEHLRPADLQRLGIDPDVVEQRAARIRAVGAEVAAKVREIFGSQRERTPCDPDASLYDGFIGDGDKRLFPEVRTTAPPELGTRNFPFRDGRLGELLFRYRARNWPGTLSSEERARWDDYRRRRLFDNPGLSEYCFERFRAEIAMLRATHAARGARLALLDQLDAWGRDIEAGLA